MDAVLDVVSPTKPGETHPQQFLPIVLAGADDASRALIARLASAQGHTRIVADVDSGTALMEAVAYRQPRLVLISTDFSDGQGFAAADNLMRQYPGLYIVMLSTRAGDMGELRQAMQAGARDCLFMPLAEAEVVRVLSDAREKGRQITERRATVLAVTSSKGGVGKSTLSVNLAVALAQRGVGRLALVDGDLLYGDVATLLDIKPQRTMFDLSRALDAELIDRFLVPHSLGFDVLAAPPTTEQGIDIAPEQFRSALLILQAAYDLVIVDQSVSTFKMMLATLDVADLALIVSTLDVVALKDVAQLMELLHNLRFPTGNILFVGNRYSDGYAVSAKQAERTVMPMAAVLPFDERVVKAADRGVPVVIDQPTAPFSVKVRGLAETLIQQIGRPLHAPA